MRLLRRLLPVVALAAAVVVPTAASAADEPPGIADVVIPATNSGPVEGGTRVVVKVYGYPEGAGAPELLFGDTPGTGTTVSRNGFTCIPGPCPDPGAFDGWLVGAIAPARPAGKVDLSVRVGETVLVGATETSDDYWFQALPSIDSVTPASGPLSGGNAITIALGGEWLEDPAVTVGGVPATNVLSQVIPVPGGPSRRALTATVPAGAAAGTVDVAVSGTLRRDGSEQPAHTAVGTTTTTDDYTYLQAPGPLDGPKITSVSGGPALAGVGGVLFIRGTKLGGLRSVLVGTRKATPLFASASQIIAFAPPLAKGSYDVAVLTRTGFAPAGTKLVYRSLF